MQIDGTGVLRHLARLSSFLPDWRILKLYRVEIMSHRMCERALRRKEKKNNKVTAFLSGRGMNEALF